MPLLNCPDDATVKIKDGGLLNPMGVSTAVPFSPAPPNPGCLLASQTGVREGLKNHSN